jgi:DNA-binding transcriptional LysR family regulator
MGVVRHRTVQASAQDLGITQTGVTQRIRALERQLGTTLFTRSRRGMQLTQEGEALLRYCHAIKDLEGETLARIGGARSKGIPTGIRVSIEGPTSLMRARVIPACLEVARRHAGLLLAFNIQDQRLAAQSLREGSALFAVLAPEQVAREMDSKLLKPEEYVLIGPSTWKRRKIQDIVARERIVDFNAEDDTTHRYLRKFRLLDHARPDRHFVNSNESLIQMLEHGLAYAVFTREFARPHLEAGRISLLNGGAALESRPAIAWYPRPEMPHYMKEIIAAIK